MYFYQCECFETLILILRFKDNLTIVEQITINETGELDRLKTQLANKPNIHLLVT